MILYHGSHEDVDRIVTHEVETEHGISVFVLPGNVLTREEDSNDA